MSEQAGGKPQGGMKSEAGRAAYWRMNYESAIGALADLIAENTENVEALAEARERLAACERLADEWEQVLQASREPRPYIAGDKIGRYCGKAGRIATVTIDPLNWNTPERLAAYCETRGCSCSMDVARLPKRYQIDRQTMEARAIRLIASLRAALGDPS